MNTANPKKEHDNIASETEARIAKAVKQFEDGKLNLEELEKIVGAVSLVGYLNKTAHGELRKHDFNVFLSKAGMI